MGNRMQNSSKQNRWVDESDRYAVTGDKMTSPQEGDRTVSTSQGRDT